jgi:hypothetical protein
MLWRELQHPPRSHPLFWRVMQQGQSAGGQWWVRLFQGVSLLIFMGLMIVSLPSAVILLVCGVVGLPALILVGGSSFYASLSAMDTASVLAQETRDGTHDLLRVTPVGAPAIDWLIASACLHRNRRLTQTQTLVRSVAIGGGLALGGVTVFLVASVANAQEQERLALTYAVLRDVSRLMALCVILYLDHVHAFIAGGVVGIISAYCISAPLEARVWAFIGFWVQQMIAYALILGLTLLTWAFLEQNMAHSAELALLMAVSSVLFYAIVREALLSGLWRWMLFLSLGLGRTQRVELP